jgi:hypothetical protein
MILGFAGNIGAGKNSAAKYAEGEALMFADPLKKWISEALNLRLEWLENEYFKRRPISRRLSIRECARLVSNINRDFQISTFTKMLIFSFLVFKKFHNHRDILQYVGTEICRGIISENIFINLLNTKIEEGKNYVITDVRFENERDLIKMRGGYNILIYKPDTYYKDKHLSENSLGNFEDYDAVVINDGSLTELDDKIYELCNQKLYAQNITL